MTATRSVAVSGLLGRGAPSNLRPSEKRTGVPVFAGWGGFVVVGVRVCACRTYGLFVEAGAIERGVSGPVARAVLDCRHAPHLEAPEETLAAAVEFVRGLP